MGDITSSQQLFISILTQAARHAFISLVLYILIAVLPPWVIRIARNTPSMCYQGGAWLLLHLECLFHPRLRVFVAVEKVSKSNEQCGTWN